MNPLLKVAGVTVRFGGVTAIDDVSFEVQEGELLGMIGPNGAGKTTMLRAITGVVRADAGKITLLGEPLDALSIDARIRKGLALSQQIVKPFRGISVLDNVVLAAGFAKTRSPMGALLNLSQDGERKTAHAMLERVDIAGYADQSPAILPLGVLKRLEMARALAQRPRLLLLDEPLAGLNSKEAACPGIHHLGHQPTGADHHPDRAQPRGNPSRQPEAAGAGQRPQDRRRRAHGGDERSFCQGRLPGRRTSPSGGATSCSRLKT